MPIDTATRDVVPTTSADLTDRQRSVLSLVDSYVAVAGEMPSAAWVGRRLSISRQRALDHLSALRRKGWCRPARGR